jgi:hypothetical protein
MGALKETPDFQGVGAWCLTINQIIYIYILWTFWFENKCHLYIYSFIKEYRSDTIPVKIVIFRLDVTNNTRKQGGLVSS